MTPKGRLLIVGSLARDVINGEERYGGSAGILALAATWLGLDVGLISVLGKDSFSQRYQNLLSSNGVDLTLTVSGLKELPTCEMTVAAGMVSNCSWRDNGFTQIMGRELLADKSIEGYGLIHLASCPDNVLMRFRSIKQPLSYEPGQRLLHTHDASRLDLTLIQRARVTFFNEEEYRMASQNYKLPSDKLVVVTLGERGCSVNQKRFGASVIVGKVVDTIGAGDNFCAGFLAGFLADRPIVECVQIASDMGAASTLYRGGIPPQAVIEAIRDRYRL